MLDVEHRLNVTSARDLHQSPEDVSGRPSRRGLQPSKGFDLARIFLLIWVFDLPRLRIFDGWKLNEHERTP